MSRLGIIALEDLENEVNPEAGSDGVEAIVDSPEGEMTDVAEMATEITNGDDAAVEAEQTSDTMGVVADNLEACIPEGGMDEKAASAIAVAVEHMELRLGLHRKASRTQFSLEGFKSKSTRVQVTQEAFEGVKATIAKIWKAIQAWFSQAADWVLKYWDKLFDLTQKYAKRADDLVKAAEKVKSHKADGKVSASSWAKDLVVDGKFPGTALPADYKKYQGEEGKTLEQLTSDEHIKAMSDGLAKMISNVGDKSAFESQLAKDFSNDGGMPTSSNKNMSVPEGCTLHEKKLTFGNKSLYLVAAAGKDLETIKKAVGSFKYDIAASTGASEVEIKEVDPLQPSDVIDLATAVKSQMEKYKGFRANASKVKAVQTAVSTKCKEMSTKASSNKDEAASANIKIVQKAARATISLSTTMLTKSRGYDVKVAGSALYYAAASLKLAKGSVNAA